MKRNKLIDHLAVILTRRDNDEKYVVTELGLQYNPNSELKLSFIVLSSLSSNTRLETNDFEVLQKIFNVSHLSSLQRYFGNGYDVYKVIEVSEDVVVLLNLKKSLDTFDFKYIDVYEKDLNNLMLNVGGGGGHSGICSINYFIEHFYEIPVYEQI